MKRSSRYPFAASQSGLATQTMLLLSKTLDKTGRGFTMYTNYDALIPGRKFEADVAIPALKIACEYQGGVFLKGKSGHTNLAGTQRDHFKCNECQLLGWMFLQFGPIETKTGTAMQVIERAIKYRLAEL